MGWVMSFEVTFQPEASPECAAPVNAGGVLKKPLEDRVVGGVGEDRLASVTALDDIVDTAGYVITLPQASGVGCVHLS
jgi:hypothetical protein